MDYTLQQPVGSWKRGDSKLQEQRNDEEVVALSAQARKNTFCQGRNVTLCPTDIYNYPVLTKSPKATNVQGDRHTRDLV